MAGASDKARFFLEKSVPELHEYERKGILTRDEVSAVVAKRSDFEHIINARGSRPADYARYVTYEMNLDSLRKKRSTRLGVKNTSFKGQRNIFFILDRATKKFPGDLGLWMQYIRYCQKEKASKRLAKVLVAVLRLMPKETSLWILAAKHYAEEQGDMSAARSYMQRGLRFCKEARKLWLQYMKLEMVYLAKLDARREILGLKDDLKNDEEQAQAKETDDDSFMKLPDIIIEEMRSQSGKSVDGPDVETLQKLSSTPALSGAIPMAIYDAAMKQFNNDPGLAHECFDMAYSFPNVQSSKGILEHILNDINSVSSRAPECYVCTAKLHLFGTDAHNVEFPAAFGKALATFRRGRVEAPRFHSMLVESAVLMLIPYGRIVNGLDQDLRIVIDATLLQYARFLRNIKPGNGNQKEKSAATELLRRLVSDGRQVDASVLSSYLNRSAGE